jgi:predicted RNase H-like nuclease (RuvC/YqgF family)
LGLPPVPEQNTENKKEEKPSLLERFAAAITGLNKNKPADTGETTDMKTNFIAVALVLAMEALALGKDEKFELSHDQMQQLEDALNAKDTEIKNLKEQLAQKGGEGGEAENDAEKRLKALEEQLATMKTQLEEKSQQIENLKKAPGAVEKQLQHMTEAEGMDFLDCFK